MNPLGAHRKNHKVAAAYYAIECFGMQKNSELNGIFLAVLCLAKKISYERLADMLQPLRHGNSQKVEDNSKRRHV